MKWFKHDTDSLRNRKIRKVIRTHGAVGYAVWFATLERLYEAENGFQATADELWLEDLAEDLKLADYRTLIRVLDTFAEVGLISQQLWGEHVIYVEAIAQRGDNYIDKRAGERDKKRKQRASKKDLSPRDNLGTSGQCAVLSPSERDLDLDQDLDPDPEKDLNPLGVCDPDRAIATQKPELESDPTHTHPIEEFFKEPPEPHPEMAQESIVEPEVFSSPIRSSRGGLVPLFSNQEKTDPIAVLLSLKPDCNSFEYRNLPGAIKQELRLNPGRYYPWNRDRDTLALFREHLIRSFNARTPVEEARSIVETWLRKANQCIPDPSKQAYATIALKWSKFCEAAQSAESVEQLIEPETERQKSWKQAALRAKAQAESDRLRREDIERALNAPDPMWTNPEQFARGLVPAWKS